VNSHSRQINVYNGTSVHINIVTNNLILNFPPELQNYDTKLYFKHLPFLPMRLRLLKAMHIKSGFFLVREINRRGTYLQSSQLSSLVERKGQSKGNNQTRNLSSTGVSYVS